MFVDSFLIYLSYVHIVQNKYIIQLKKYPYRKIIKKNYFLPYGAQNVTDWSVNNIYIFYAFPKINKLTHIYYNFSKYFHFIVCFFLEPDQTFFQSDLAFMEPGLAFMEPGLAFMEPGLAFSEFFLSCSKKAWSCSK